MEARESLQDVENLRFRFQMNNRLRLECLAAVSKVFREFGEPIRDELLSTIVFALPQELVSSNGHGLAQVEQVAAQPPESPQKPQGNPPERPEKPGLPPEKPSKAPALPPEQPQKAPALPPEQPLQAPALPPEQPAQFAGGYIA